MVTISITAEAFEAIRATLSAGAEADTRPDGKGGFHITLPRDVLDRLKLIRQLGESYSDVILRIAVQ
jgi:predicted CopG family antitoxin